MMTDLIEQRTKTEKDGIERSQLSSHIYLLRNHCPICGTRLYASWDMPISGLPQLPVWSVECDRISCDYVIRNSLKQLKSLL